MAEPKSAAAEFDAIGLAKELLRATRSGALATLDRDAGFPFASLVTVATDLDGSPLLLLSRLSAHTLNLEADPRASVLLAATGKGDPLAHPRLTVIGQAARTDDPRIPARFLARHPKAKLYAGFADFSFWRIGVSAAHLNGGFARAANLPADAVLTRLEGAEELVALEEDALAHLNADHRSALNLYATVLAGQPPAEWRATGIDPEGIDLMAADATARVAFPRRVETGGALRQLLKDLADDARRQGREPASAGRENFS